MPENKCFPHSLFVEVTAIKCVLCPCADSAGTARSDPAAGRSDSPAPGPAGSAPADHHPAAPGSHHRWTEPGFNFRPVESVNALNQIIINMTTECLTFGSSGAADQRAGPTSGTDS